MVKTRYYNNVINHIGLVHTQIEIKLLNLSNRVQSIMKTKQDNNMTDCISMV